MKLVIITSNHLRHNAFVSIVGKNFDIVGVFTEDKARDPSKKGENTSKEDIVKNYFKERSASEKDFFEKYNDLSSVVKNGNIYNIKFPRNINDSDIVKKIISLKPDYIAVFGSSIIKEDLIDAFPDKIINMHLGLSPYYRGSGTNFWPLYDEKLEYVGVTIHYLDKGIDTGKIIMQGRPIIKKGDTPHSIGNKTIKIGAKLFVDVLKRFEKGKKVKGVVQDNSIGKLCLFKDYSEQHIVDVIKKFNSGLVDAYLDKKKNGRLDNVVLVGTKQQKID